MSSYIVHTVDTTRRGLYGKNNIPEGINDSLSQYQITTMEKYKVRNCVMFNNHETKGDQIWCSMCQKRRIPMTKHQLLSVGLTDKFNDQVNAECKDGISYLFCPECSSYHTEPTSELVPVQGGALQCTHCQFSPENGGKKKTYSPKLMYENINDNDKIVKYGEPQELSVKIWYWYCSLCSHREPMLKSSLVKKYTDRSFLKSIETRKKKPLMNREDVEDLQTGLGGTPTSLIDGRDIPPP
jgi:hypothetical protein